MRRTLLICVAVSAAMHGGADLSRADFAPRTWGDPRDAPEARVDLRRVAFGQVETHLVLRLRAEQAWTTGDLAAEDLCLTLVRKKRVIGRLCAGATSRGAPALRFGEGESGPLRPVRAAVERRGARELSARIAPHGLGLPYGDVRWFVTSGVDRVPDRGDATARISAYGAPRCFGAAGRPGRSCLIAGLARSVFPTPPDALLMHDGACQPYPGRIRYSAIDPCEVGNVLGRRTAQIALVGDSHSAHLRATVDVAARARGWRAITMTRPGCSFSTEVYLRSQASCRQHSEEALAWLRTHPRIHTLVTSSSAGRGLSSGGYQAIWRRVPATVRRILVVRDVPRGTWSTGPCVEAVRRRHAPAARACPIPRGAALIPDTSAAAAASAGGRVRLVDLTRRFCDARSCYPVVGGVYVFRDKDHLNRLFAATLGPFLLRELR